MQFQQGKDIRLQLMEGILTNPLALKKGSLKRSAKGFYQPKIADAYFHLKLGPS